MVSVIMSCYNSEKYLDESIESILAQTYTNFEFLIVDDNSNDSTYAKLQYFSSLDTRVKVWRNSENKGLTTNLNFLIGKAEGEIIVRMDGDDISALERIQKQVKFFNHNPDIDVLGTNCIIIDENSAKKGLKRVPELHKKIKKLMPFLNTINHPSVAIRSSVFEKVTYNENYRTSQDWDLWLTLLNNNYRFHNLQDPLLFYRMNDSYLNRKSREYRINELKIKMSHFEHWPVCISFLSILPTIILAFAPNFIFNFLKRIDPR